MHGDVKKLQPEIEALCREHGVDALFLFGSAALPESDVPPGDLDFVVRFEPCDPEDRGDRYLGLLVGLEDLFQMDIDLLEESALKNPYFSREVFASRIPLYAA